MKPRRAPSFPLILLAFGLLLAAPAVAHPVPDIPVRSSFNSDGTFEVRVEVDPRSFEEDPELFDYYTKDAVEAYSAEKNELLQEQADAFVEERLRFHFEPLGVLRPEFVWTFQKLGDEGDLSAASDEAVLIGSWKKPLPEGLTTYQLESRKLPSDDSAIPMNVVFLNTIGGEQMERYAVLFPGETSFAVDLTELVSIEAMPDSNSVGTKASGNDRLAVLLSEIKRGFLHVVPLGMDHVLFVLGVFLLSRKWKPLLLQISAFTIAHTLTLWLASAGWVNLSPKLIEPIIAASIVTVAIENIVRPRYNHWRLAIVFIFGLIHGLGFAGVMSTRLSSTSSLIVGLLGINIGVELGQLLVIAVAMFATVWIRDPMIYRRWIVVPGSVAIALAGLWWVLDRTIL